MAVPNYIKWFQHSDLPIEEREPHREQYGELSRWCRDVPCIIGSLRGTVDVYVWRDPVTFVETDSRFDVEIGEYSFTVDETSVDSRSHFPPSLTMPIDIYGLFKAFSVNGKGTTLTVTDLTLAEMNVLFKRPVPGFTVEDVGKMGLTSPSAGNTLASSDGPVRQ